MGDKNVYHFKVKRATKRTSDPDAENAQNNQPNVSSMTANPFATTSDNKPQPAVSVKEHMDFEKMILERMRLAAQQQKQKEEQNKTIPTANNTTNDTNGHNTSSVFAVGGSGVDDSSTKEVDIHNESLEEMKARQAKERDELRRKLLEEEDGD